jgi:hypothetical protein
MQLVQGKGTIYTTFERLLTFFAGQEGKRKEKKVIIRTKEKGEMTKRK